MNNSYYEIQNVSRTNVSRRRINTRNKRTKTVLEAQAMSICKDKLGDKYIHNSFSKFDGGYVYYDRDEDEILSFCLWKIYNDIGEKRLHVLLLCSKYTNYSLGSTMLDDIEYYCSENKIKIITLNPADKDLYGYYENQGYYIDITDKDKDKPRMIKMLIPFKINRGKYKKTRRLPKGKQHYPVIASTMPMDMNIWKNQNF